MFENRKGAFLKRALKISGEQCRPARRERKYY
jgi:hypothetical protein